MKRMMFLMTALSLFTLVACGQEGPSYSVSVKHDGVTVDLDTWYSPPGLGERIYGGADGISMRISIGGKTVSMIGNYFLREWDDAESTDIDDYSPLFWAQVAEKFNAIQPPEEHKKEHAWLYSELVALRDMPLGPGEQALRGAALTALCNSLLPP